MIEYNLFPSNGLSATLVAVGDVMFARDVSKKVSEVGVEKFFENCGSFLKSADLSFCNFESPITDSDIPSKYSRSNFKTDPRLVSVVADYFNVVSLANNHIYDYCVKGAEDTVENLRRVGVKTIGVGNTCNEAHLPVFFEPKGIKIGFLAYMCLPVVEEYSKEFPIALYSDASAKEDIQKVTDSADICIVSFHGGHELVSYVEPSFVEKAHKAIDYGAHIVLGHHSHVLSGIEIYNGRPIVFSLGNFIFDNPTIPQRKESIIVQASLDKEQGVSSIRIIPVHISDDYIPNISDASLSDEIEARITRLSQSLADGKNDELYWETAAKGFLNNGRENLSAMVHNLGPKGLLVMIKRLRPRHFKLLYLSVRNRLIRKKGEIR